MKVIVLGAGGMGQVTALTVAEFAHVTALIVADLNLTVAESVAAQAGPKASAVQVDVSDRPRLLALFRTADLVLNTVGPFFRFGVPVLQCAIEARILYADINDDWQPTQAMLALSDAAKSAGMIAILGLGASPGISNMLALKASHQLDSVDALLTGWDTLSAMDDPGALSETPSAALLHWLHQTSGLIRVQANGQPLDTAPLQEYSFRYPALGQAIVWTVGHPEPITLPRTVPSLSFCANVMTGNREMMQFLKQISAGIDRGELDIDSAAAYFLEQILAGGAEELTLTGALLPSLFAVAFGQRDGRPMTVAASLKRNLDGGMAGSTGVPLALAALLFESSITERSGVFAPEDIIDPDHFFRLLAPYTLNHNDPDSEIVIITEEDGIDFPAIAVTGGL